VAYYQIVVVPHFVYFTFGIDFLGNNALRKSSHPSSIRSPASQTQKKFFNSAKVLRSITPLLFKALCNNCKLAYRIFYLNVTIYITALFSTLTSYSSVVSQNFLWGAKLLNLGCNSIFYEIPPLKAQSDEIF